MYTVAPEETADINVSLQVGDTKGIGDAILTISQVDNPGAIPVTKMLTAVSSDAKYLEVNAGATMETTIKEGGRTSLISLSNGDYNIVANKLDPSVVVWNFGPKGGINVAQANIIVDMIGKGIGVLMNGGVALPFLTFESTNHPLLSTLGLNWASGYDIQLSQFTLEGVAGDPVADGFKVTGSAGNNGNYYLQPMIITNSSIATEMVKNTDQGKTISARIVTPTAKAIYMGFNLDVITNITDRTNFIKKAIDWIEGTTDVNDNLVNANISLYPNPSSDFINVNGLNGQANVTDLFGRIVWSGFITNNSQIDITTLSSGVYMLNINNNIYKIIKK
ncbi:MAG TPA: T9SS type A sorting domain-containing protein [Candidatus Kapabacteria bacterium]|nr:T9SS type A sorting domain-containing protein [Candidatus Kapabacteria bacterium]